MALLSCEDSTPRAYRLKVSNAALPFSTMTGTSPTQLNSGETAERAAVTDYAEDLKGAEYATLNHRAVSRAAKDFVEQIASLVEEQESLIKAAKASSEPQKRKGYGRGPAGQRKLCKAVEGFLGDLLTAAASEKAKGWVYRRLNRSDFSGERVTFRVFEPLYQAMVELELVQHVKGAEKLVRNHFYDGAGRSCIAIDGEGQASRFRATGSLLAFAAGAGIDAANIDDHFSPRMPQRPLVLKTSSYWDDNGDKHDGRRLDYKTDDTTKALEAEVKALNAFLAGFEIKGGGFYGFFRCFNQGAAKGYGWNKGGRLYGVSERRAKNFQLLPGEERHKMTIGSEPVVEIDISSSYLTMLYGLRSVPFDPDAGDSYEIPGLPRAIVKAWVTATLGHKRHFYKWPSKVAEKLKKQGFDDLDVIAPIEAVRDAMLARHPVLRDWEKQEVTWADLMYAESTAVIATMTRLMNEQRPSLCVHDSIIVRASDQERAKELLREEYHMVSGIYPKLDSSEQRRRYFAAA